MAAANEHARTANLPREIAMAEVQRYAREIVPTFNAYIYFRIGYSLARTVAQFFYRVRLGFADEKTLAGVAPGTTVVFVMNHRSNMDYVLVAFLAAERTALSYAVGEWARIWPLQQLIRSMGAYFVRRNPTVRSIAGCWSVTSIWRPRPAWHRRCIPKAACRATGSCASPSSASTTTC